MKTKLEQKRYELRAELGVVEKQINNEKPVDGFRIFEVDSPWMAYLKDGKYMFGIGFLGTWVNEFNMSFNPNTDILSTPEEVNKRLTEFVNGLGYKEEVTIKGIYGDSEFTIDSTPLTLRFMPHKEKYQIGLGGWFIWSSVRGWAKIVEKPNYTVDLNPCIFENETRQSFDIKVECDRDINPDLVVEVIKAFLNK